MLQRGSICIGYAFDVQGEGIFSKEGGYFWTELIIHLTLDYFYNNETSILEWLWTYDKSLKRQIESMQDLILV